MIRPTLLALLVFWHLFPCLFPSYAYVLQGPHILDLMIESYGTPHRLLVTQTLKFFSPGRQEAQREIIETLGYAFPDYFRADIQSEETQRIYIQSLEETFILLDGNTESDKESSFDLYKDILLFRTRELMEKRLDRYGVDVSVSSLGRFEDRLAYVVGAQYPDESVPQIWIDKESLLPFRWIVTRTVDANQNDALEVRYLQWQKRSNAYYPMEIAFYQGDSLLRTISVQDVQVDPTFPDAYFDISYQKSIYQSTHVEASDSGETEEINDVQKAIEDFKKIYE